MSYYRKYVNCGANLDPGEVCPCQSEKETPPPEKMEAGVGERERKPGCLFHSTSFTGNVNSTETDLQELIVLVQEPIIEERLHALKEDIEVMAAEAQELICTEETIQTVKAARADLTKRFDELEIKRKAIKAAVLDKYNAFEAVYKECVTIPFKRADADLKGKIGEVERDMKRRCEDALREYFDELCQAHSIDFIAFERAGIVVSMADARAKTQPPKKLREQLDRFVSEISKGIQTIDEMEHADEIMVVFRRTLDATSAIGTVLERHRRIEEERAARESRSVAQAQEAAAVAKVDAFAPPVSVPPPVDPGGSMASFAPPVPLQEEGQQDQRLFKCRFTAYATKAQLKRLKEFLLKEEIRYE